MRVFLASVILTAIPFTAFAQIDPSSALLLNGGSRHGARDNGLDSGRYKVKPKSEGGRRDEARGLSGPSKKSSSTAAESASPTPTSTRSSTEAVAEAAPSPTPAPARPMASDSVGGEFAEASLPKTSADPLNDRRYNLLEISVAPAFVYTNSDSSYFFRSYNSASPAVSADAKVWLNPELALSASYLSTLSGHVSDSTDGSKNTSLSQQWLTAGIRSRKFFDDSRMSPALTFGVDYFDYKFRVPSDAVTRGRLSTTGILLSVEAELPVSSYRYWTFSFQLGPKLQHTESATGVDFQSGGSVDANSVGLSIGNRLQFDRTHTIFWKVSHTVQNDLFTGDATLSDPVTSQTPSGVAVTESFTVLQFGYSWGN